MVFVLLMFLSSHWSFVVDVPPIFSCPADYDVQDWQPRIILCIVEVLSVIKKQWRAHTRIISPDREWRSRAPISSVRKAQCFLCVRIIPRGIARSKRPEEANRDGDGNRSENGNDIGDGKGNEN